MSILAMVGAMHTPAPTGHGDRSNFTTPEPVYTAPPRPATVDERRGWEMATHEKARLRAAALRAKRIYPGAVGELISRELLLWEELGQRLGSHGLIMRAVHDILTAPTEPDTITAAYTA